MELEGGRALGNYIKLGSILQATPLYTVGSILYTAGSILYTAAVY